MKRRRDHYTILDLHQYDELTDPPTDEECGTGTAALWLLCLTLGAVGIAAVLVLRFLAVIR